MRRNIRRHTDRDTARSVHEQVRYARRKHDRFCERIVVIRLKIDRFLVDIGDQFVRDSRHANLGVTHRRRCVTIDGTKVTLAVDEHVAQGKWLRHAYDRVVNGGVAVRVIFTHHFTDDTRGFLVRFVPVVRQFTHREQGPPVDRFQSVANIRERAPDNDAHRVIHVGLTHFVFNTDGD